MKNTEARRGATSAINHLAKVWKAGIPSQDTWMESFSHGQATVLTCNKQCGGQKLSWVQILDHPLRISVTSNYPLDISFLIYKMGKNKTKQNKTACLAKMCEIQKSQQAQMFST